MPMPGGGSSGSSRGRVAAREIIAVMQKEAEWRRAKNFVVFLHTGRPNRSPSYDFHHVFHISVGGLSSADWSVRRLGGGGGGSMPAAAADGTAVLPSPGARTLSGRPQGKVLENRDLCRIVASYIPTAL